MYFSSWLPNIQLVCINLKSRVKKRKIIKQHLQNRYGKFKFFIAKKHDNPKRGCLESHLQVIQEAIARGDKAICIVEDDAQFIGKTSNLPAPPTNWDMLYLGGTVKDVYGDLENEDGTPNRWVKMRCWTTHGYIINLQNETLVNKLLQLKDYKQEVDRYYLNKIHPFFNCYMANPMVCIQRPGYSDIEGQLVSYEFMKDTLRTFRKPEHETTSDQSYIMKLPEMTDDDLPFVSIITPTYNRRSLFALSHRNFVEQNYPAHKLEWIIIDDSDDKDLAIDDLIPTNDTRINHIILPQEKDRVSVAYKRNLGVKKAQYDIIVHMDDDDYYPPDSVLVRVKLLLKEQKTIGCVGCSSIGIYDLIHDASSISSDGTLTLSEASMAYTRKFWEEQPFNSLEYKGEYFSFIQNRFDQIIDIP